MQVAAWGLSIIFGMVATGVLGFEVGGSGQQV